MISTAAKTAFILTGLVVLAPLLIGLPPAESAQKQPSKTYVVIGTGVIQANKPEAAKKHAIADAKLSAVELMAAELLPLETLVEKFNDLNALLYLKPDTYIEYYRVLNELTTDNEYRVMVQATVSARDVAKKLKGAGILQGDAGSAQEIELTVEGTRELPQFVQFRRSLTELDGVETAQMREMRADAAVMSVLWRGNTDSFADTLVRSRYDGFNIRVYQTSDNALRVELITD